MVNQKERQLTIRQTRRAYAGYLGLKVKKRWLLRMRDAQPGFSYRKTIECRSYPPKPPLQPGDTFYLLCCGEVWGRAILQEIRPYRNLTAFQKDAAYHHVKRDTCGATGPASYDTFTGVFSKRNSAVYGYVLSDVTFFRSRPTSGTKYDVNGSSVRVPLFLGQRFGQTFFTGIFPRLH
jgi:hypothetical protein